MFLSKLFKSFNIETTLSRSITELKHFNFTKIKFFHD